jgi:hypothetical protein
MMGAALANPFCALRLLEGQRRHSQFCERTLDSSSSPSATSEQNCKRRAKPILDLPLINGEPGAPVASGKDIIVDQISMHARTPVYLPRQTKALADMGKKHHVLALAVTRGAGFPSEIELFQAKGTPVRVKKMRYNKDLETFSESMGSENALAASF